MKNKKKLSCILTIIGVVVIASGCSTESVGDANVNESEITEIYSDFNFSVFNFVDPETGVNYLIYDGMNSGSMCQRYNADGTLYLEGERDE